MRRQEILWPNTIIRNRIGLIFWRNRRSPIDFIVVIHINIAWNLNFWKLCSLHNFQKLTRLIRIIVHLHDGRILPYFLIEKVLRKHLRPFNSPFLFFRDSLTLLKFFNSIFLAFRSTPDSWAFLAYKVESGRSQISKKLWSHFNARWLIFWI